MSEQDVTTSVVARGYAYGTIKPVLLMLIEEIDTAHTDEEFIAIGRKLISVGALAQEALVKPLESRP